jgi:hypothetical protein
MKTMPTVKQLKDLFTQVNKDCAKTGEAVVKLTDWEYYSAQIQNIYELGENESIRLAKQLAQEVA